MRLQGRGFRARESVTHPNIESLEQVVPERDGPVSERDRVGPRAHVDKPPKALTSPQGEQQGSQGHRVAYQEHPEEIFAGSQVPTVLQIRYQSALI
jgi:hypothetical protein